MEHLIISSKWDWVDRDAERGFRVKLGSGTRKRHTMFLPVRDVIPKEGMWNLNHMILPRGDFGVRWESVNGILVPETVMVVPEEDTTDRCLLFIGAAGGFRGTVSVFQEGTTGTVLMECSAGNGFESCLEAAVILEPDRSVAFRVRSPRHDMVLPCIWKDGKNMKWERYTTAEWTDRFGACASAR